MEGVDIQEILGKVMTLLEQHFGTSCESVLHDLSNSYEHSIVDIRNGHITGRRVGDPGSNLGLEIIQGNQKDGDRFNYITHIPDGKTLRSSSVFLRDRSGKVAGCICVNQDISDTIRFEAFLRQFNQYNCLGNASKEEPKEFFARNVGELLDFLIKKAEEQVGKTVEHMTRQDKIKMIGYLNQKGAFQIMKSSEQICEVLGISKYTFYHYLELGRSAEDAKPDDVIDNQIVS